MLHSLRKRLYLFLLLIPTIIVTLPSEICFADANKIFIENNKAVVVIVAYNNEGQAISQGSGFIVREDGAIVTNYHVISNAAVIKIKAENKVLRVEGLLYIDKENDIVILKAEAKGLPIVKLGDIHKSEVGEKVYVISSPQGLKNTISDGILSGIREIASERKILQITAPLSEGSSGGPVFNKRGEVIGIATAIIKEAQNLNFAMPVNLIKDGIFVKKIIAIKDAEIEDYKKTAEYWFNLGVTYSNSGNYAKSIEAFKQAIKIKPFYAYAHLEISSVYYALGMYQESIKAARRYMDMNPDHDHGASVYFILGANYIALGNAKKAIHAFKEGIQIKPGDAEAHYYLGNSYRLLGMYKEAKESYKQSIRIDQDDYKTHTALGIAYLFLNEYTAATEAFKQAIRINPDSEISYFNLGNAYLSLQKYTEAKKAFKQAININPNEAIFHALLGITYLKLNERGLALTEYEILKELDLQLAEELFDNIYK